MGEMGMMRAWWVQDGQSGDGARQHWQQVSGSAIPAADSLHVSTNHRSP